MNKIIKLFESGSNGNREDMALAINLLFAKFPEIRKYQKNYPYPSEDCKVVYYEDILHIIPWATKCGSIGMLVPEYIKL